MNNDESGFRACVEEYALKVGRTVEELNADEIFAARCRCRPHTSNPHCGGFYIAKRTEERVPLGDGTHATVISWKRITALHGEAVGVDPAPFPPSVLRQAIDEFEGRA